MLPGVLVREDGRYYVKAASLSHLDNQVRKLSLLMDVSRSIMAEIDLHSLLELIMSTVTRVMAADRSTLFLVDRETGDLWSKVAQGSGVIRVERGAGIAGHVAATGEIANIADAYKDPRFNQEFDRKSGYKTRTILCMPIKNPRAEIIGTIQVLNKLDGSPFNTEDEEMLGAFSSLAGISLENARAYEELEKEKNSLEVRVAERTRDLADEKKKSDDLLLNILPAGVAEELKRDGQAMPRGYDLVSVMFTDFKGFTQVAENLEAAALVAELDKCFFFFDELVERFNLEKIKTIGDSYMCAGGIPVPNRTNPVEIVLAALEIQAFMSQMREIKLQIGEPFWQLRLGIHTGPVVAGVVGKKKFAYDIWGDTVNTASRMESSGEVDRVNISEATFKLVEPFFTCTYRGMVAAKNKGQIGMYFVEGIRPELCDRGQRLVPNQKFRDLLQTLQG